MRNSKEIMNIINDLVHSKNISYAELSRRTNTSKAAMSRYKNGTRQFPVNKAYKFAEALGVSMEYLLDLQPSSDKSIDELFNQLSDDNKNKVIGYMQALKNAQK